VHRTTKNLRGNTMSDASFVDPETYNSGQDKTSFREVILIHLRKINGLSCVEWHGGFWMENTLLGKGGIAITNKVYIPDSREIYSNAVENFSDMLFAHFDEDMLAEEKDLQDQMSAALKDFSSKVIIGKNTYYKIITDQKSVSFRDQRRVLCRHLFRSLCSFLKRKSYLSMGSIED